MPQDRDTAKDDGDLIRGYCDECDQVTIWIYKVGEVFKILKCSICNKRVYVGSRYD